MSGDVARGRVCLVFPERLGAGGGGLCPAGGAGRSVPGISFVKVTDPVVPSVGLGSFLSALHGAYQSNRKHIGSQT